MQSIFDWLTSVLAILLCAAAIDMLIPESVMQKYVRLVTGLVIMTAIVSPVFSLLTNVDFSLQLENEQRTNVFQQQTDDQLNQLMETESLTANPYMEQQVYAEAEAALRSYPSCLIGHVEADVQQNDLNHLQVTVEEVERGGCPEEKIMDVLTQKWNMDAGQLNIVIQKGDAGGE
ncbi:stage III sporulation protein AF [Domibacillus epiphyticus]|uniref:Stage III sporulation protein AF n=1 Tax=Domibacillus epiphyticus TaxID=1714355 RepID=A0A1V2A9N2_9BACI|nr:stage III sporulation protein AF [Domibacillus epiphyticus]OMP67706.1 stage III sporulation protein AF [Domibacillus epiphyticus]